MVGTNRRSRWARRAVGALVAAIALAACGDSERSDPSGDGASVIGEATTSTEVAPGATDASAVGSGGEASSEDVPAETAESTVADAAADRAPGAVEDDVVATFESYRQALLGRDGAAAAGYASTGTIEWYDTLLGESLTADEADLLDTLPLGDALSVVVMRANLGDELRTIVDGRDLFVRGVELGLVGDNVATLQLSGVDLGDEGEAFGLVQGFPVARFVEEADQWRFDMVYTVEQGISGQDEGEVIPALTAGVASTRLELFEVLSAGYGTTWAEVSTPLL